MTPNSSTSSRPPSSMSQSVIGPSQQPRSRPVAAPRKPRPISIAVTGVTAAPSEHQQQVAKSPASSGERPPLPKVNVTKKSITPKVEAKKLPGETGNNKQPATVAATKIVQQQVYVTGGTDRTGARVGHVLCGILDV